MPVSAVRKTTESAGFIDKLRESRRSLFQSGHCTFCRLLPIGLSPRQVVIGGPGLPFRHQLIPIAFANRLARFRFGVMDVAEESRVRRAGHYARGLALSLRLRLVVDAVDAQCALRHHLAALVELPRAIRTGP